MKKLTTLRFTDAQLLSLGKVIEYLIENESAHFEECKEDADFKKSDHIFFHTERIEKLVRKQTETI